MLNDIFICCPDFLEILKFVIDYIFNLDLSEKEDSDNINITNNNLKDIINFKGKEQNKFLLIKFTLINFVKEADVLNLKENNFFLYNLIIERLLNLQVITMMIIRYLSASLIFYNKIIQRKNLEKLGKIFF
jgi:hypothetical protein